LVQVDGVRPPAYAACDFRPGAVTVVAAALDVHGWLDGFNASSPEY
jgi:hypothetical protein